MPAATTRLQPLARWARLGVTTSCALGAAVLMRTWGGDVPAALWVPTGLLVLSAALIHHRQLGSQLVARSVWWANLVLGTVISLGSTSGHERAVGVLLCLAMGTALLAMGRVGLEEGEGTGFRPIAFRATLTFGMIMAVADAQALTLFGALKLQSGGWKGDYEWAQGASLLVSATLLVVAIAGLYRLRVWGLLLSAASAVGVCALSATDAYGLPFPLGLGLAATSGVQVLLCLPVLRAIVRGRAAAPSASPSRLLRLAPTVTIALMMAAPMASWLVRRSG
jgi:hypothetical protein